jgi:hypothetical protein
MRSDWLLFSARRDKGIAFSRRSVLRENHVKAAVVPEIGELL